MDNRLVSVCPCCTENEPKKCPVCNEGNIRKIDFMENMFFFTNIVTAQEIQIMEEIFALWTTVGITINPKPKEENSQII